MAKLFTASSSLSGAKLVLVTLVCATVCATWAFADPPGTTSASPCQGGADPFAKVKEQLKDPDRACSTNMNAAHEKELDYPCQRIWAQVGNRISEYEKLKSTKCQAITKVANNIGGGCESRGGTSSGAEAGQKQCYLNLANQLKQAARSEKELAAALEKAKKEVSDLIKKAEEAKNKYNQDQQTITEAMRLSEAREQERRMSLIQEARTGGLDPELRQQMEADIKKESSLRQSAAGITGKELIVPAIGEVKAPDGAASTISGYQRNIEPLKTEQEQAVNIGSQFSDQAGNTITNHQMNASKWEKLAAENQARAAKLGVAPATNDSPSKITGGSSMNNSPYDNSQAPAAQQTSPTQSGMPAAMPPAGMPVAPGMSPGGMGSDPYGTDPGGFGAVAGGGTDAGSKPGGSQSQTQKKDDYGSSGGKTEFAGLPEGALPTNSSGGLGASSSPSGGLAANSAKGGGGGAARGVDGSSSGKASGSGESMAGKDTAAKTTGQSLKGFEMNLNSGGTGILGSEVASTVDDLSNQLGLDASAGLTEEERAAFASLEGNGEEGRTLASLDGVDASVGGLDSQPLFYRTRGAHERALKRGNLMVTVKTRL